MSLQAITWAWKQTCPTSSAKLVLLKLADYANEDGHAWSSLDHLADCCQMDRRTVIRSLSGLRLAGIIHSIATYRDGRQTCNTYRLPLYETQGGQIVTPPVTPCHPRGGHNVTPGGDTMPPNPEVVSGSSIPEDTPLPPEGGGELSGEEAKDQKANLPYDPAPFLAGDYLEAMAEAGIKPVAVVRSIAPHIRRLLRRGVSTEEIRSTIAWLFGAQWRGEYRIEALSGRALVEKWDRIQARRLRERAQTPADPNYGIPA